jgi:hypothetical protein
MQRDGSGWYFPYFSDIPYFLLYSLTSYCLTSYCLTSYRFHNRYANGKKIVDT